MDNTKRSKVAKIFAVTGNTTVSKSSNKAARQTAATSNAQASNKSGANQIIQQVAIDDIRIDKSPKTRVFYNIYTTRDYANLMKQGEIFPPPELTIDKHGHLIVADGLKRIEALKSLGRKTISAIVKQGSADEAFLLSLKANSKHGVPYTREDKRMNICRLLNNKKWSIWSDREIARRCGVTHKTVGSIRSWLSSKQNDNQSRPLRSYLLNGQPHRMDVAGINRERAKEKKPQPAPDVEAILKKAIEINQNRSNPVALGDRFLIKSRNGVGYHVVMCGDSTDPDCLKELFGEKKADLYLTDPPYNAAINSNRTAPSEESEEYIANNKMNNKEFKKFLSKVFSLSRQFLNEGAAFYIWSAFPFLVLKMLLVHKILGLPHEPLVWKKKRFVYHARYDYNWGHELCIYGWIRGQKRTWLGNASQTTIFDGTLYEDTPFDIKAKHHPCPKPVAMTKIFIENSLEPGKIVYDSFLGSGTTLIAAEITGRLCYGVELLPAYVAVLLDAVQSQPLGLEVIAVPPGISIHAFIKSLPAEGDLGLLP